MSGAGQCWAPLLPLEHLQGYLLMTQVTMSVVPLRGRWSPESSRLSRIRVKFFRLSPKVGPTRREICTDIWGESPRWNSGSAWGLSGGPATRVAERWTRLESSGASGANRASGGSDLSAAVPQAAEPRAQRDQRGAVKKLSCL